MGLYDRDYMREAISRHDPYFERSWESKPIVVRRGRSFLGRPVVVALALIVGVFVLPLFTIAGRHWMTFSL